MQENRQIDLGGFTLYDSAPLFVKDKNVEDCLTQRMVSNIHFIFLQAANAKKQEISKVQSLPQEEQIHDFDRPKLYFDLPEPSILFPRSKRIPEKRLPTKWEKFAKEKGITKKKRTGLKYDKDVRKVVGRWGAKSKANAFQPAIMEQKQKGRNPFQDQGNKRSLKKQKQKLKYLKNKQHREQDRQK